jgi:glycosyltransferase involved in cell wall biosynthesis
MLTDTPIRFDRRVQHALREHGDPPLLVLPRRTPRIWRYVSFALAVACLPGWLLRFGLPLRRLGRRMKGSFGSPTSGLRAFVLLQAASLHFFWTHRRLLCSQQIVYAHDQMAGVVALLANRLYGVPFIYDAHEIVPFRARRTGLLRMLLEFGWERALVRHCTQCHVVNRPMRRFYRHLYGAADFRISPNDFFLDRDTSIDPSGARKIVYVGAIGRHRGLEHMAGLARQQEASLLCFSADAKAADVALLGGEVHGIDGYEDFLVRAVTGSAPYFWCCFDIGVFSYRYSLPNKFFQAVALGIPIIAARGSYLGRLASRYGIGAVVESRSGSSAELWSAQPYAACVRSMSDFRSAYRRGEVSV